ncbi:MAG: aspartyl protease family protein [Treponema sp.]|jgi:clan AA aspartic protease|nr:aspartyl protease family protein [Treponema sp.]
MGTFTEEITLANAGDISAARNGLIPDTEIRALTLDAMPDTGAWTLVINEEIRQRLGLAVVKTVDSSLADGSTTRYGLTEPVEIRWKDRDISLQAVVIPKANDILLGALVLEGMDLYVDPVNQRLAGVHGDQRIHLVK